MTLDLLEELNGCVGVGVNIILGEILVKDWHSNISEPPPPLITYAGSSFAALDRPCEFPGGRPKFSQAGFRQKLTCKVPAGSGTRCGRLAS